MVVKMVISSDDKLMALNKEYRKLMETTVKFDDECKKNKCHELEIDIVR